MEICWAPDKPNKYLGFVLKNSIINLEKPTKNKYSNINCPLNLILYLLKVKYPKTEKYAIISYYCVGWT